MTTPQTGLKLNYTAMGRGTTGKGIKMKTTKARRRYTAPIQCDRCTAHAISAVNGEGAQCMHKRIKGAERCAQHELAALRVIAVAAAMDTRFSNPQVAAFNRERAAKSDKWRAFWRAVAHALHRPYSCQMWMQDESNTWALIRAHQARAATGARS